LMMVRFLSAAMAEKALRKRTIERNVRFIRGG
jgi:hypothetical protein